MMEAEPGTEPRADGPDVPRAPLDMRPYPHFVCPRCHKIVQPDADRCARCGQALGAAWSLVDLAEELAELPPPGPPTEPTDAPQYPRLLAVHGPLLTGEWDVVCPVCEADVDFDDERCGACEQALTWGKDEHPEEGDRT